MHNPIPKNANFFIIILFLLVISTIYLYSISAEYITNPLIFQMKGWRSQFFHCKCPFSIFPPHIEWIVFVFHTLRQQNNRNFISFQRIISKKRLIATIFQQTNGRKATFLEIIKDAILPFNWTVGILILPQLPLIIQIAVNITTSCQHKHYQPDNQKYLSLSYLHVANIPNNKTNVRGTINPKGSIIVKLN